MAQAKKKSKRGGARPRKPKPPPPWNEWEEGHRDLNFDTASEIRDERAMGKPVTHLALEFGVKEKVIQDVEARVTWGDAR